MKILSTDIWHANYEKSYKYISRVYTEAEPKELNIGIGEYKIKKTVNIDVLLNAKFFTKDKKEEIGRFHCAIVTKIELTPEEVALGNDLKDTLEYTAVTQAWPLLNVAVSQLKNIKVEFEKLPMPPSKEALIKGIND